MKLDRYKNHNIEVVIDKLVVSATDERRLKDSLRIAMKQGDGLVVVLDAETNEARHFSKRLMCPVTGLSYGEPAPHNFSFNSPHGACHKCKGLGEVNLLDMEKIVPDSSQNIYQGGIAPLGKYKNALIFWQIEAICDKYGVNVKTPIRDIPEEAMDEILNGTDERLQIKNESLGNSNYFLTYEGVSKYILMQQESEASASAQKWAGQFIKMSACPECNGQRLNKEALHYKIAGKNIADISGLDISELSEWVDSLHNKLSSKQQQIATEILKEFVHASHQPT
jgi:excinuclease ABC subunit A